MTVFDRILHLEDRVPMPVDEFVGPTMRNTIGLFPPRLSPENVRGEVYAVIDNSRWIVHCPNPVCGGALLAPRDKPFFCCVDCGSPENNGLWYSVVYPANKVEIEGLLLARPHTVMLPDGRRAGRGWEPGQTVADLDQETKTIGVKV